ncbi:MAG: hypothetical protein ACE5IA_03385 [Dehalococcoidia bacterium]
MLKKGLFIGLAVIVVGLGIVIPALAKTDLPPSAMPKLAADADSQGKASLVVIPAVLTVDKKKMPFTILGSGFAPHQEVSILISMGGVVSDISYLMKPPATANVVGAFAGEISGKLGGRLYKKKLIGTYDEGFHGIYTISAVDMDGNLLATAPLWLVAPPAE